MARPPSKSEQSPGPGARHLEVPFTASTIAAEVSRQYGAALGRTVETRVVANSIRRRCGKGFLREVRGGRPYQETLYQKAR